MKIKNCKLKICNGFTLVELLVVIAIISILTIISLSSFTSAQIKAKDSQRKSDLNSLSKALMMYFNDKGVFPDSISWGSEDGLDDGVVGPDKVYYIRRIPEDPKNIDTYIYEYKVDAGKKYFNLFANLENEKDKQCLASPWSVDGEDYCYGIASPNTSVRSW